MRKSLSGAFHKYGNVSVYASRCQVLAGGFLSATLATFARSLPVPLAKSGYSLHRPLRGTPRCAPWPGKLSVLLVLLALLPGGEARAACDVATTNIAFGGYDVFSAVPRDSTGTVTVSCDEAPPSDVVIAVGPSAVSGGFNPRRMRHSVLGDALSYNLFSDPSMGSIWGDGTAGTTTVPLAKVKKKKPEAATIYGRIPAGQNVSAGSYGDTLTVTITW